jgi:hypothetical protein
VSVSGWERNRGGFGRAARLGRVVHARKGGTVCPRREKEEGVYEYRGTTIAGRCKPKVCGARRGGGWGLGMEKKSWV